MDEICNGCTYNVNEVCIYNYQEMPWEEEPAKCEEVQHGMGK